jgi:site-specific recombinase XerD
LKVTPANGAAGSVPLQGLRDRALLETAYATGARREEMAQLSIEALNHYTRLTIEDLKKTREQCHPSERAEA